MSCLSGSATGPSFRVVDAYARGRVAVVDAECQDQHDLADEHQAEEEGEAAHRIVPAPLESPVIDLIDRRARHIEDGDDNQRGEKRIKPEAFAQEKGAIGAEHDERRMGDVGDVEETERNGRAGRHACVKAAEQQAGHDRVRQEIEREHGRCLRLRTAAAGKLAAASALTGAPFQTA